MTKILRMILVEDLKAYKINHHLTCTRSLEAIARLKVLF